VRCRSLALPSRVRHSTLTEITTAGCPTRANHRGLGRFQPLPRPGHRTVAGLAAARARGRNGGRPSKLSPDQVRAAQRLYNEREHTVEQIGSIFGVSRTSIYRALRDFGGHGVGHAMHEAPSVPNEGRAGRGVRLRPGLVIAIEPWFLAGGNDDYRIDSDGWTLRSADGSPGAHVEHTIAITDNGPRILTAHAAA